MPVTMQDIADRVNVSRSVVSAVLSGKTGGVVRVSAKTRERILAVVHELSYHRNRLAVSTRTEIVNTIAVITASTNKRPEILDGIIEGAMSRGYDVKIFLDDDIEGTISGIIENRIGSLISLSTVAETRKKTVLLALKYSLKAVFHFEKAPPPFPSLNVDFAMAGFRSAEYLAGLGHRRIAAICGPVNKATFYKKEYISGYRAAMEKAGLAVMEDYENASMDFMKAADMLLSLPEKRRPTAICCINDAIAYYIFRAAAQRNIVLPRELSVVGFGNFAYSDLAFVPLTTFDECLSERGKLSVDILLGERRPERERYGRALIEPRLVLRESAVPPGDPNIHSNDNTRCKNADRV